MLLSEFSRPPGCITALLSDEEALHCVVSNKSSLNGLDRPLRRPISALCDFLSLIEALKQMGTTVSAVDQVALLFQYG